MAKAWFVPLMPVHEYVETSTVSGCDLNGMFLTKRNLKHHTLILTRVVPAPQATQKVEVVTKQKELLVSASPNRLSTASSHLVRWKTWQ